MQEQIRCVARELALRRNVYPKWVEKGRMKQDAADKEIATMEAVLQTLNTIQAVNFVNNVIGEKENE